MKFREPLQLTCPHCELSFERPLAWIRQEEAQCPQCRGSLSSIRGGIESLISDWEHFVQDVQRIMAMEEEFHISIPDADTGQLRTFADAHDYLRRRLVSESTTNDDAEQIWKRLCSAIASTTDPGDSADPVPNDPLIRTDFSQEAT